MPVGISRALQVWSVALLLISMAAFDPSMLAQRNVAAKPTVFTNIAHYRDREAALPRNLHWSPDGRQVAFVRVTAPVDHAAVKFPSTEIWSLDAANGKQTLLLSDAEVKAALGGERPGGELGDRENSSVRLKQLKEFSWAPGGHALLLASASTLAWVDLDTHKAKTLVTDRGVVSDAQISPDGKSVSYIREHSLWLVSRESGATRPFTSKGDSKLREGEPDWAYAHEFGMNSAQWWSPDSRYLAWMETNDRAVNAYSIHNVDGDAYSIAYPAPGGAIPGMRLFVGSVAPGKALPIPLGSAGKFYLPVVKWLPDGKHLAVERLSRDQKTLDLLLVDASTGAVRTILTEQDAYWINISDGPYFLKDSKRFVWMSERSGYRHLYLKDISGKDLAQLTHGDWEVSSLVGVDESAGSAYFTSTEAGPAERPLYRVNLDGSAFTRITHDKGTHELLHSPANNMFLDTFSTHASPPRMQLLGTDGNRVAGITDQTAEEQGTGPLKGMEFITLHNHLGAEMNAWVMKPMNFSAAQQYPVIFYVGGGPGKQIVRDAWGGDISLWMAEMTQRGYVVVAIDAHGSAGHGHLFEEPLHLRFSASEMADVRDAVSYVRTQPWADKTRIGICGWGFGGFLALHGMLDRPLLFKAGFAGAPITDWHLVDAIFSERYLDDPTRNQDGWLASSPTENAKNLNAPLLLAEATMDESVHPENAEQLLDELLDNGKYADILLFPDRHDVFEDYGSRLTLFQRLTEFFQKNL